MTGPATVAVRRAGEDDVAAIAEIRVRAWQAAYRGIVPQGYLDTLRPEADADRRRARWAERAAGGSQDYLGELAGRPAGWLSIGPYRDDEVPPPRPDCGEIYALYVHPVHWRAGVGGVLLRHAVAELAAAGRTPVVLWVLTDNAPARRFYQRAGFAPDGAEHLFAAGGALLPELRYRYR